MKREEVKEKAKQTIDDIFAKIDQYEAKGTQLKDEAKVRYEKQVSNLKQKKKDLEEKYHQMVNATEQEWDKTQTAFKNASESFKEGFAEIASIVK